MLALHSLPCPLCTGMAFQPDWWLLRQQGHVMQPPCFCTNPTAQSALWWEGILNRLTRLARCCTPSLASADLQDGTPDLDPHPNASHRQQLHTQCCLLTAKAKLAATAKRYKLKTNRGGQGPSSHYVKVKEFGFDDNDKEFYLHSLLCSMYHGPPPDPTYDVHHKCHHSCCILPWHLEWVTHSDNVLKGNKRRRQEDCGNNPLA
jgi:hypothetical protein